MTTVRGKSPQNRDNAAIAYGTEPIQDSDDSPGFLVQDLSRYRLPPDFRGRPAVVVQLWWLAQSLLFATSPQFLYGWRRWLLRRFGAQIGAGALIRPSARITYPWKVTIGERSMVGDYAELYSLGPITIGADAIVSQKCYLCTGTHDHLSPTFDISAQPIVIGDEAWLAADVFVHPGLTIGRGAVIAARSTLHQDAVPYGIYAGSPAVLRGDRRDSRPRRASMEAGEGK